MCYKQSGFRKSIVMDGGTRFLDVRYALVRRSLVEAVKERDVLGTSPPWKAQPRKRRREAARPSVSYFTGRTVKEKE